MSTNSLGTGGGDIRSWSGETLVPAKEKCRRGAKGTTASVETVEEVRPARTEFFVCGGPEC